MFSFLVTSLITSRLSATVKRRTSEAVSAEQALRQAQTDLAHVNRVITMGELTASLADEVNQPIAAAITDANTCLRWLVRDIPDVLEARDAASRTIKDATRAAEIVNRVRLLFKKGIPERELVDVNELIREMVVLLRSEAMRYSIATHTELAPNLPQVIGDRVQLQQVFMNLIVNAIDAMKDGDGMRELAIKSQRAEAEQIMISVSDTGVGLPPGHADQIFNAFFTTKAHGTGMGLRITAPSWNRMAADCWLLPTLPAARVSTLRCPFATPQEFLRSKRADGPSCLVLDVRLPGVSGLDFQRELGDAGIRIPIIFITGHGDIPMTVKAMKFGAVEFLTKPFRDQDLLDAIHQALDRDRLTR